MRGGGLTIGASGNAFNALMLEAQTALAHTIHLYNFWLALDRDYGAAAIYPEYHEVARILSRWLDGEANDHMTVLRLRRLTEVAHAA